MEIMSLYISKEKRWCISKVLEKCFSNLKFRHKIPKHTNKSNQTININLLQLFLLTQTRRKGHLLN
jgi:hypothetical protein